MKGEEVEEGVIMKGGEEVGVDEEVVRRWVGNDIWKVVEVDGIGKKRI